MLLKASAVRSIVKNMGSILPPLNQQQQNLKASTNEISNQEVKVTDA